MVAALQQVNENLHNLNQNPAPSPSSQPLAPLESGEYRGLNEFCKRNPSQFQGGFAPDASNEWIQDLDRIFRAMGCNDVQMENEGRVITRVAFKEKFLQKYFPADLKRKKEMEFLRMYEDDLAADEVVTPRTNPPRHFGPQRSYGHGKGKSKVFQEERKPYSPPTGNRGSSSHGPRCFVAMGFRLELCLGWCVGVWRIGCGLVSWNVVGGVVVVLS
ncbi:hypothetical protein Lal_00030222 [Lupinus albus]|nr:hypothetical protein Lal_00030222 [Lupinus albus]